MPNTNFILPSTFHELAYKRCHRWRRHTECISRRHRNAGSVNFLMTMSNPAVYGIPIWPRLRPWPPTAKHADQVLWASSLRIKENEMTIYMSYFANNVCLIHGSRPELWLTERIWISLTLSSHPKNSVKHEKHYSSLFTSLNRLRNTLKIPVQSKQE